MASNRALVNALILLSSFAFLALSVTADDENECVYTVYVRTGLIIKAGTDSNITLELWDQDHGLKINNIEKWGGLMGRDYDYFERGNLDVFSGRGPCLDGPVCAMRLTSDGSGPHPGWYCSYVEVTTTGPHKQCAQQRFDVQQWLATNVYPYQLTAMKNYCSSDLNAISRPTKVVSKSVASS